MKKQKLTTIICPYCGREYLPSEIFVPRSFFGNVKSIIRTNAGKIDTFFGNSMDLSEEYICDKCDRKFKVTAKVAFNSSVVEDFNDEYVSKINRKITMQED